MDEDVVRDEVVQPLDGEVEDLLGSRRLDRDDLVPVDVTRREVPEPLGSNCLRDALRPLPSDVRPVQRRAAVLSPDTSLKLSRRHARRDHCRDDLAAPGFTGDDVAIRVSSTPLEVVQDHPSFARPSCTDGADTAEETDDILATRDVQAMNV